MRSIKIMAELWNSEKNDKIIINLYDYIVDHDRTNKDFKNKDIIFALIETLHLKINENR